MDSEVLYAFFFELEITNRAAKWRVGTDATRGTAVSRSGCLTGKKERTTAASKGRAQSMGLSFKVMSASF